MVRGATATDVAIDDNGGVHIVSREPRPGGSAIYDYIGDVEIVWAEHSGRGGGVRIGAGRSTWLVNDGRRAFAEDSQGWFALPGAATDIASYGDSSWIIGNSPVPGGYTVHRFDGVDWDRYAGGAVAISVGPDGNPWVVNSYGETFRGTTTVDRPLCPIGEVGVPESATSVNAATLLPGERVTVAPDPASRIWAGYWLTGDNGPQGWTDLAPPGYPLPGARRFSLLLNTGLGWRYLGSVTTTVQNRTGSPQALRFRTNDDVPGNGSGQFTANLTFACRT